MRENESVRAGRGCMEIIEGDGKKDWGGLCGIVDILKLNRV